MRHLWTRVKAFVGRLFRRAPPAPGRFESSAKFAWRGWLATTPWIWPRREYLVYVPAGWSWFRRVPLLVFCHGCKQTPEEFAQGTRVAALADRLGCLVLLPRQKQTANAWRCWNWFDPAVARGLGEAAIVAAMIRSVRRRYHADRQRVMAVGISAGGALAAALGVRHPEVVRAIAVHSGLPCGAASSAFTAIGVMQRGPETDVEAIAAQARIAAEGSLPVPLLAIHGLLDNVVASVNAVALVRQYLRLNGHPALDAATLLSGALPPADAERSEWTAGRREVTFRDWRIGGRLVARHVAIAGLAHAWSGGYDAVQFNDPAAPDATALIGDFLRDALP
jgi:poly(hydroxyalkanoate) depolymerase family esterase